MRRRPRRRSAQGQRYGVPGESAREARDITALIGAYVMVCMVGALGQPCAGAAGLGNSIGLQQHEMPYAGKSERTVGMCGARIRRVVHRTTGQFAFNRTQFRRGGAIGHQQQVVTLTDGASCPGVEFSAADEDDRVVLPFQPIKPTNYVPVAGIPSTRHGRVRTERRIQTCRIHHGGVEANLFARRRQSRDQVVNAFGQRQRHYGEDARTTPAVRRITC